MDLGVPHDALRCVGPARLELRLDENERVPPCSCKGERRRQDAGRGDERDVARDQLGCEGQRVEVARVHPLEHDDAWIGPQPRVELPVADVERNDPRRAALQEAVGEASVEAPRSRQSLPLGSTPSASRACASFSPPRETNRGGRSTSSATSSRDLLPGLFEPGHEPGENERLRLRAALGEPALHEHDVEALLGHVETMPT